MKPRDKIPKNKISFLMAFKPAQLLLRKNFFMRCQNRTMRLFASLLLVLLSIVGCASPEEQQAYVRGTSDRELCMSWMTAASMNQYQSARINEIRRRGLDCWKFGNIAEEQRRASAAFQGAVNGLSGQQRTGTVNAPMGFTNCTNQGAGVFVCTGPRGSVSCADRGMGVLSCQ